MLCIMYLEDQSQENDIINMYNEVCKDKTVSWQSYIHDGNPMPGNTVYILRRPSVGPIHLGQFTSTHLMIGYLQMKPAGTQSTSNLHCPESKRSQHILHLLRLLGMAENYLTCPDITRAFSCFKISTVFPGIRVPIIKIWQSWNSLIFIKRMPALARHYLYIAMVPKWQKIY